MKLLPEGIYRGFVESVTSHVSTSRRAPYMKVQTFLPEVDCTVHIVVPPWQQPFDITRRERSVRIRHARRMYPGEPTWVMWPFFTPYTSYMPYIATEEEDTMGGSKRGSSVRSQVKYVIMMDDDDPSTRGCVRSNNYGTHRLYNSYDEAVRIAEKRARDSGLPFLICETVARVEVAAPPVRITRIRRR